MQYPALREIDPSVPTRGDTPLPHLSAKPAANTISNSTKQLTTRHHEILHLRLDVWQHAD